MIDVQAILARMLQMLPTSVNRDDLVVRSLVGDRDAVPADIINVSADYNTGALVNEISFCRLQTQALVSGLASVDDAVGSYLDLAVAALVNLTRADIVETDLLLRSRFRSLTRFRITSTNPYPKRQTRWAVKYAVAELLGNDLSLVFVTEWFRTKNLYMQVRVRANLLSEQALDTAYVNQSYINQSYIAGISLGIAVASTISDTINRTKAAGVKYDLISALFGRKELTISARIQ